MTNINDYIGDNFKKALDSIFKEHGAKLHINKMDYAYLKLGPYKFYFHRSKDNEVEKKEQELMNGDIVIQHILPYDGWEISVSEVEGGQSHE